MKQKSSRTGDVQNASPVAFDLHLTNKPKKRVLHSGRLFQINLMDKGASFYNSGEWKQMFSYINRVDKVIWRP